MKKLISDRRFWIFPILGWTLIVASSLYWNLNIDETYSNETVYEKGYQAGESYGGRSVTFPSASPSSSLQQKQNLELIHAALWLTLTVQTLFWLSRHRSQLLKLHQIEIHHEKKVNEYTARLEQVVFAREEAEERLRRFINASGEGLLVVDRLLRCTLINPSALKMLGYDNEAQLLGRNIHDILCPQKEHPTSISETDCKECRILYCLKYASPIHDDTVNFRHSVGHTISVDMRCSPIEVDGYILGSVITFSDISKRKEQEANHWRLANTDSLTGLINRHYFLGCLEQTFAEAERYERSFVLLFIDLDGFKTVNDRLGHDAGDELLREASKRLLKCVRASDIVARLGGDEFTIIMPDIAELEEAEILTHRMINWLSKPFVIKGEQVCISASVGIAAYPYCGSDSHSLLNHADAAMYSAKTEGKNTFCWYQELSYLKEA